jgi:hypothetical protein
MRKFFGPAATIVWIAGAAQATTIVPMSDAALVDRAPIVALVEIESATVPPQGPFVTDWTVSIERVLKGAVGEGRVVVRLPGGRRADGSERRIFGAPRFAPGRRALVFLTPRADGSYELADFALGAFLVAESPQRPLAVRDLSEVRVLGGKSRRHLEPLRDLERFADWIEDRAAGSRRRGDYLARVASSKTKAVTAEFTLFEHDGRNFRWFLFDTGGSVPWRQFNGLAELETGGEKQLNHALLAWTGEKTTPVKLVYAGRTTARGGLAREDGQNAVLFGDPNGEISGTFDCGAGGTLAIGGFHSAGVAGSFNGKEYYRITEGDVVLQNGIECNDRSAGAGIFDDFIRKILGHELGHTLGIAHSSENADETSLELRRALMYYRIRLDGTGPILYPDDVAALQALYRRTTTTPPPPPGPCGANALCLLKGRFRVTGTWSNQFNGTSGTAIPIVNTDLSGFFYFGDKANIELIVKILDFGSEVKVFYSQLTNLRFTLTVTEVATGRTKSYANTPGECGAIDQNFATGPAAISSQVDGLESITASDFGTCVASTTRLCLLNRRFAVTVDWRNQFDGSSGVGKQKTLSNLTGAFGFTELANLELLIKALDFGDRVLVLYGALSNLEYTIRITDTSSGTVKTYHNPAGQYCGGLDENAF